MWKARHSNQFHNIISPRPSQYCRDQINRYGFCTNPDLSNMENLKHHVEDMPLLKYSTRERNMKCNNMCDPVSRVPLGVKSHSIKIIIDRLKRDLRLTWYFKYHIPGIVDNNRQAYILDIYIQYKDLDYLSLRT